MYSQVVVLTYQPPDVPAYTYKIPKDLEKAIKVGQLVSVPFGKRNPIGVVLGVRPLSGVGPLDDKVKIKSIDSILLNQPILLAYQIELLKWMADYYHAPMVNCLKAILPELPSKLLMENRKWINTGKSIHYSPFTIHQTLVLVPTINRIPETLAQYPNTKNYVIYHNELAVSEKFSAWQKILSGNVDYVFGSRSAIFSPCPNLKEIIIYDEHEEGYYDERSPYYSALTIAEKIKQLTGSKIKIIDSSPKVTTYFNHMEDILMSSRALRGDLKIEIASSRTPRNDKRIKTQIVSMLAEKAAGNRSPLSQILEDYIKLGYSRGKKILLFLNKKSASGHVYCRSCKYSDFALKPPAVCPQCQSQEVFFNSTNVNSLANLVKKIVSDAGVNVITKKSPAINLAGTIDIATATVFYKLATRKYDLVAHIQTDSLLSIPDYTSAEKLFAQIASLKKIAKSLLLLQTYNPQHPTITSAAQGNWQKFYQSQLAERKALSYPPFTLLVKLSSKGKKEENVEKKAQILFEDLNSQLSTFNSQLFTILGPYKPAASGKLSKYNIILKIPLAGYLLKDREKAVSKVSSLLSKVPKGTLIEVEANSLN